MATTRFKGETAGERLDLSGISDNDMIQLRHKPGTIDDADKGISKSQLLSCPFGVSDTAAATAAKAASLTDSNPDFTLVSGREVVVCFTTANSASNPTLNFAGSGAIPIYYPNGQAVGAWPAETWMHLKYFYATVGNSTIQRWILLSPILSDTVAAGDMNVITSNAVAAFVIDSVTNGNMRPLTSNAAYNNFTNKHRQTKVINVNTIATLTLSSDGYYNCYLITLSRDNVSQLAVGVVYWSYNSQIDIYWIKQVAGYTVTLTKESTLKSHISVSINANVRISILDLNGSGLLTLS